MRKERQMVLENYDLYLQRNNNNNAKRPGSKNRFSSNYAYTKSDKAPNHLRNTELAQNNQTDSLGAKKQSKGLNLNNGGPGIHRSDHRPPRH